MRRLPWWLLVFALALVARLAFLFGLDEPLSYTAHFDRALSIVEHPRPLEFVLRSDAWRGWGVPGSSGWTLAPLSYLVAATVLALAGPSLKAVQLVHCVLESGTAVGVGFLGRALVGPRGAWAGVAYAVHWQAIAFHSGIDTENVHTVLLVSGLALLADPLRSSRLVFAAGGFLLGASALARPVALAFLPLVALQHALALGWRRGLARAGLTLGGALIALLPWTVRDVLLHGELVPIETVSTFNLWNDNAFVDEARWGRQARLIDREPTAGGRRAQALDFALLGWRRDPAAGLRKVTDGLEYFFRPSEAHQLLVAETPHPWWRHALAIGLGDLPFLFAIPLAMAFAVAGPRAPARALLLTWLAYYLALLVIVFHTQVRYRTAFTPFLFACAAGGAGVLAAPRRRAWLGLLAGVVLVGWAGAGHVTAASRAISSAWTLRAARSALDRGDTTGAAALVERAASKDAGAARPFTGHGRWLAEAGRADEAAAAYQQALAVKPGAWLPLVVLPRLLADAGRGEDAARALALAHAFSHEANAWQALEAAWRELPAPRATEVSLGAADYGAVRGFMAPGAAGRWSRARAWLRLRPPEPADLYEVTIEMGSPEPSPLAAPEVQLRAGDGGWRRVSLDRQARPFVLRARPGKDGAVVVELRAPAWTRRGSAPELGVLVRRFAAARAGA